MEMKRADVAVIPAKQAPTASLGDELGSHPTAPLDDLFLTGTEGICTGPR